MEEIIVEKMVSRREAALKKSPTRDSFAAESPSFQVAALTAQKAFYGAQTEDEAAEHLQTWQNAMSLLCELRDGSGPEADFPRDWFYPVWYEKCIAVSLFHHEPENTLPTVAEEAEGFLGEDKRRLIEKMVRDRLEGTSWFRTRAQTKCLEVGSTLKDSR